MTPLIINHWVVGGTALGILLLHMLALLEKPFTATDLLIAVRRRLDG